MNTKGKPSVSSAEPTPENTNATHALDQSEHEYNRMISQQMMYHKMMMDDLMKLSSMSESGSGSSGSSGSFMNPSSSSDKIDVVSGLGTTIRNVNASNQQLLQTAAEYADQGKQKANTVAKLNAYIKTTNSKLNDDINAYDAIVKKEGFANANPTMDAALEMSEIMSESQKYALVIFGAIAIFLLYKTMKHL